MNPVRISPDNFLVYLDGESRVLEWNGNIPRRWGITYKESAIWSTSPSPITEMDGMALMDVFGLLRWTENLPLAILQKVSPAGLMDIRRKKEARLGLKKLYVFRDGSTDWENLPAEKFN